MRWVDGVCPGCRQFSGHHHSCPHAPEVAWMPEWDDERQQWFVAEVEAGTPGSMDDELIVHLDVEQRNEGDRYALG